MPGARGVVPQEMTAETAERGQAQVSRRRQISSTRLEVIEKREHMLRGHVIDRGVEADASALVVHTVHPSDGDLPNDVVHPEAREHRRHDPCAGVLDEGAAPEGIERGRVVVSALG